MSRMPKWLESLLDDVANCMEAHSALGPLGYRYQTAEEFSEVFVYACPAELVGGAVDGSVVSPCFSIDMEQLRSVFDDIDDIHWNAHGVGTFASDGPHISIEGVYHGLRIFLQVLANAPAGQKPVFQIDTSKGCTCTTNMANPENPKYNQQQGQYLAFIYYYAKIHGQPPSEAEMERYFQSNPPTVHQMVLKLEKLGFISRVPRQPRSIKVLLAREELPELE